MRVARGVILTFLLLSFGGALAGCDTLESLQFWDTKKKLAGDRKPVFPGGVPGVTQGIPPELVKGYQEPQTAIDPAAVAAQQSAEKAEPKPEPKPASAAEEPTVHVPEKQQLPEPKPAAKPPEPPKPEVKKPEPPKPEPKKPEPPKVAATKPEPARPLPKPPEAPKATAARPGSPGGNEEAAPHDAYGAAAERWRQRIGGGVGGKDGGSGPIGSGGEGKGGGGQLVGLEFIAYRQQVINTIKAQWTNVLARPGMVAAVRFEIAPDGQVSNVRLAQSSGNPAYDASAMRAVQHVGQLPPPPARYVSEFHEFVIEFHSEESGGRGAG